MIVIVSEHAHASQISHFVVLQRGSLDFWLNSYMVQVHRHKQTDFTGAMHRGVCMMFITA